MILSMSQGYILIRYSPHADYKGPFHVFNEPTEEALLRRFYSLISVFQIFYRLFIGRKTQYICQF